MAYSRSVRVSARRRGFISGRFKISPTGDRSRLRANAWLIQHAWKEMPATRFPSQRDSRRSEEHTSELQSLMRISYAVFCLKKKKNTQQNTRTNNVEYNT